MYSIQELQGFDYLLKRITNHDSFALYGKELKLVIELNNSFWYGDFVQMDGSTIYQDCMYNHRDFEKQIFYKETSALMSKSWDTFAQKGRAYTIVTTIPVLYNSLSEFIKEANIKEEDSEIYPFLLNAKSLDGTASIPFIDLSNKKLKLVSIIDVTEQSN